ncbi:hypothetical protein [Vibrio sonorensis]|uniref:hypothetical protein n=1 Tax=Vibrio sonorensis TaxID=1004316 RepID=UPI0008D95000|nr:hypothetical protein [Vibrio sonorensis]
MKIKAFSLVAAVFSLVSASALAGETQVCTLNADSLSGKALTNYTQCCDDNNGEACYLRAWTDLEMRGKDQVAALYYKHSCEIGYASGCRTAGQLASDQDEKDAWYNKGCDLKDLDSCLEVDRMPF